MSEILQGRSFSAKEGYLGKDIHLSLSKLRKKLAKHGLIGCWSHLSSELLIASRWWLWCSFIFKQSLVFQSHRRQSRVELQSGKFDSSTAASSSTVTSATAAPILQTIV